MEDSFCGNKRKSVDFPSRRLGENCRRTAAGASRQKAGLGWARFLYEAPEGERAIAKYPTKRKIRRNDGDEEFLRKLVGFYEKMSPDARNRLAAVAMVILTSERFGFQVATQAGEKSSRRKGGK